MEDKQKLYRFLGSIGTALVVMAISSFTLWQKQIFWESIAWQCVILALLFSVTNPWAAHPNSVYSRYGFWTVLPLIFILNWRVPVDVFFIYSIIWIACSPFYMSQRRCWLWLVVLNVTWYLMREYVLLEQQAFIETLLISTFFIFALYSATAARESALAYEKTQQLNRELLATQHLLNDATRDSERTRIARDLHDLLGHHLTALTINLQVAGRLSSGEAKDKIDECYALSKLLLNDVREAVSTLRSMPVVDLRELLEIAIRGIPRLDIKLQMSNELKLDNVNTAEALLRMVQEAITNTLKHTNALKAEIEVYRQKDNIVLNYTDSGDGCDNLELGNGLTGMRERIEQIGGELKIETRPKLNLLATAPAHS